MNDIYKLNNCTDDIFKGVNVKAPEKGEVADIKYHEINIQQFYGNSIIVDTATIKETNSTQIYKKQLQRGDIIIHSRTNMINKIAIFDIDTDLPCVVNHQYIVIRPEPTMIEAYYLLSFLLESNTKKTINTDPRNVSNAKSKIVSTEIIYRNNRAIEVEKIIDGIKAISIDSLKDLKIQQQPMQEQKKMETIFKSLQQFHISQMKTKKIQSDINNEAYRMNTEDGYKDKMIKQLSHIESIMSKLDTELDNLNAISFPENLI